MLGHGEKLWNKENVRNEVDDNIYLNEDRYTNPKEMFKVIGSLIEKNTAANEMDILDVGCATGEFIYYLSSKFKKCKYTGIDISESMLQIARNKMPSETWQCEDIFTVSYVCKKQFDVVLCVGVLQIFDDIEIPINNLLSNVKEGGALYIAGLFNSHPVDVITRYRTCKQNNLGWQSGWNIFSTQTYEAILAEIKSVQWSWHEFTMPYHIKKTDDPMRTWTEVTEKNSFQLVNGASQNVNIKILEVKKIKDHLWTR